MSREDPDVVGRSARILSDEGIQVLVAAETLHVRGRSGEEVSLAVRTRSRVSKRSRAATSWSRGAHANTAGIGLEQAGVELDGRGYFA